MGLVLLPQVQFLLIGLLFFFAVCLSEVCVEGEHQHLLKALPVGSVLRHVPAHCPGLLHPMPHLGVACGGTMSVPPC